METKLSKVKRAWLQGDYIGALRIVAKFGQLGDQKEAITRAWAAYQNPAFYRETGKDPQELIQSGITAIRIRYGL